MQRCIFWEWGKKKDISILDNHNLWVSQSIYDLLKRKMRNNVLWTFAFFIYIQACMLLVDDGKLNLFALYVFLLVNALMLSLGQLGRYWVLHPLVTKSLEVYPKAIHRALRVGFEWSLHLSRVVVLVFTIFGFGMLAYTLYELFLE